MISFLVKHGIPEWATVLGFVVSVVGFTVTIVNVARAKSAARQAREAAFEAHARVMRFDVATELVSAISALDEIKRLQRKGAWEMLLERYGSLRRSLISIKTGHTGLQEDKRAEVQSAIQHMMNVEELVETAIAAKEPINTPKLNSRLSRLIDGLQEILIQMKDSKEG